MAATHGSKNVLQSSNQSRSEIPRVQNVPGPGKCPNQVPGPGARLLAPDCGPAYLWIVFMVEGGRVSINWAAPTQAP